jgi:small-conductance mechanosensitive channel
MVVDNRIEDDPEHRAELHRREMRMEARREPVIGTSGPLLDDREEPLDVEESIAQNRTVSRLLITLGVFFLMFAGFWLIFVGWDVRDGREFTIGLMAISAVIGLVLIVSGAMKRSHQPVLRYERRRRRGERAA